MNRSNKRIDLPPDTERNFIDLEEVGNGAKTFDPSGVDFINNAPLYLLKGEENTVQEPIS